MAAPYATTTRAAAERRHPQIMPLTNALERLHRSLREIIKTRGKLPERRGRDQAVVRGDPQCRAPLETTGRMDRRDGAVCDPGRGSLSDHSALRTDRKGTRLNSSH